MRQAGFAGTATETDLSSDSADSQIFRGQSGKAKSDSIVTCKTASAFDHSSGKAKSDSIIMCKAARLWTR